MSPTRRGPHPWHQLATAFAALAIVNDNLSLVKLTAGVNTTKSAVSGYDNEP
jgi:hypothetical protein